LSGIEQSVSEANRIGDTDSKVHMQLTYDGKSNQGLIREATSYSLTHRNDVCYLVL